MTKRRKDKIKRILERMPNGWKNDLANKYNVAERTIYRAILLYANSTMELTPIQVKIAQDVLKIAKQSAADTLEYVLGFMRVVDEADKIQSEEDAQ